MFTQFKQLLTAAEAKATGYDELHALLHIEPRSVGQLERALKLQQRHIDRFTAQDLLLAQFTQQMAIQAQAMEQLQSTCRQQKQQLASAKAQAAQLQQEVGHKRKRIEALQWQSAGQEQSISKLENRVHEYKRICSYVARESQDIDSAVEQSIIKSPDQLSSGLAETEAGTNVGKDLQDSSLAEGAAGLLAMTNSTADRLRDAQSSDRQEHALRLPIVNTESSKKDYCGSLELRGVPMPKRASCLIIGRHPQVPREVRVVCKQLTGILQLGDCGSHLHIKTHGSKIMTPPEFETAAGCSKGKNWKANIKVQGSNGRNQMLKVWLPGLMQLVGDQAKAAVACDAHINTLLDPQSGLRILPSED
ncbi:hypothetical protein WJX77_002107 [Trebouxia sp. C0004]